MSPLNRIPKSVSATIILAVLLFSSVPVIAYGQHQENLAPQSYLSAELIEMVSQNKPDLIPVNIHFSDIIEMKDIMEFFEKMGIDGFEIRHVFKIIPVVSAYATVDAISDITKSGLVEGLSLDHSVKVDFDPTISLPEERTDAYEHPDEIMDVNSLWDEGYNGTGITVAVLDSGADGDHPDIDGTLVGFRDFVSNNDDMNPSDGIDAYDDNGHGTACCWLVAGNGAVNGGEYKGLAPGADVLAVKVLDSDGAGDDSVIAQGIEFAVEQDVDVISLSLGGTWTEQQFFVEPSVQASREAVDQGITVVVAAGNDGPAPFTINSPAITEEVITVGSSSGGAGIVAFSSNGPVERTTTEPIGRHAKPDLVAPGLNVLSARAAGANSFEYPIYNSTQYGSQYTVWSGTSASAPQVAALAAVLMEKHTGLTPLEVKTALMKGATNLGADSMSQGWGLANASKSSEILEDTSRAITLMAPRQYPTLPGSSTVLIVGSQREPQNVTIISTVTRGSLDISATGNASQYIVLDRNVINVGVGYTYFGIGLDIPKDLPISAVGNYLGSVSLMSGSETIATLGLEYSITTFGGRLLVDMGHHSADDQDDPSFYRYFGEYLLQQGVLTSEIGSTNVAANVPIDLGSISTSETLMIMDTETQYSDAEVQAIHDFVDQGGTLLILSEFYDSATQTASFGIDDYNEILAPYGIQCERNGIGGESTIIAEGEVYGANYGGAVESHPLMEEVEDLYILLGSTFRVDPSVSGAQGLFWQDSDKEHAIVAFAESGRGKVIAIGDGSTLYDNTIYDAAQRDVDNLRLLRNIASEVIPESPRVYDVELRVSEDGNQASLNAYVFDNNIDEVTVTLIGPDGSEIDIDVEEELGYKYQAEFALESRGFFEVSIVATDLDGNQKVATRTLLIPADVAQDEFTTTVVFSLLIVVAIGLAYVGYLKFSGKPKKRRRVDREWEPQWEDDTGPPSIQ